MKRKEILAIIVCLLIGLGSSIAVDIQNKYLGRILISSPMIALLVGMLIYNLPLHFSDEFKKGSSLTGKKFLNFGIILTGATLSFYDILGTGIKALPLIILNLFVSFKVAEYIGKYLGVSQNTSILVGGGTSICGGTAIATLSRIIKAREEEIAFAMAAIFLFDTLAAFSYPYLADLFELTANQFAFWAGTAINDTSSVAGAQSTYVGLKGLTDWNVALNIKLVRTTMLIFVSLFWVFALTKKQQKYDQTDCTEVIKKTFPRFILGFVVMAGLNTVGIFNFNILGQPLVKIFGTVSKFMFATALAGVGFKLKIKEVFASGIKPIILGGITWSCVCFVSLIFILVFESYVG